MGFRDKDNKLVGFDIDLARAVGKELGVKVKFKPIEWKAKEAELKSKNIDWPSGMVCQQHRTDRRVCPFPRNTLRTRSW